MNGVACNRRCVDSTTLGELVAFVAHHHNARAAGAAGRADITSRATATASVSLALKTRTVDVGSYRGCGITSTTQAP